MVFWLALTCLVESLTLQMTLPRSLRLLLQKLRPGPMSPPPMMPQLAKLVLYPTLLASKEACGMNSKEHLTKVSKASALTLAPVKKTRGATFTLTKGKSTTHFFV